MKAKAKNKRARRPFWTVNTTCLFDPWIAVVMGDLTLIEAIERTGNKHILTEFGRN